MGYLDESKYRVSAFVYTALLTAMYLMQEKVISIPYIIPVKQILLLVIVFCALTSFLIHPRLAPLKVSLEDSLFMTLPFAVMIIQTLPIWFFNQSPWVEIYRGLWNYFFYTNQLFAALLAGAILYKFGENGIWLNLVALLIVNLVTIVSLMLQYGVVPYLKELFRLIITFAGETGEIMEKAELHEIAYCIGMYLLYMLMNFKKDSGVFKWLFIISLFCFLSAFKRIAIPALLLALLLYYCLNKSLNRGHDSFVKSFINIAWLAYILLFFGYIVFIYFDGFHWLESLGIDTMSREDIYDQVDSFFSLSPTFIGNGMGWLSYEMTRVLDTWVGAVHNDYLQFYIDLGFFGFLAWLLTLTYARTAYFGRNGRIRERLNVFILMTYLFVTASTDNTMNYQDMYIVTALLTVGCGFNSHVAEAEEEIMNLQYRQI